MTLSELQNLPVAVVVFSQTGCPGCTFYLPVFKRVAQKYARCIPHLVVDVHEQRALADAFKVKATPTTIVVRQGKRSGRAFGGGDTRAIENLFRRAMKGTECRL